MTRRSPTEITVRAARPEDIPALGRLGALLVSLHHDFDPRRFIRPTAGTERAYAEFLTTQLEQPDAIILVAAENNAVVGYAYAGLEGVDFRALRGPAGVIYDLIVDPARRREGIGRMLLQAVLSAFAARGAPRVVLSTAKKNEAAQRLFTATGFRRTMIEMTRELEAAPSKP